MSTWKQAMKVAQTKAFATRKRWTVLGHRDAYVGWCYHAWSPGELKIRGERNTPPRERR